MNKPKLIRITTVPESLGLFKGQPQFMSSHFQVIGVSSPGDKVREVEVLEGIKVHTILMTRSISPRKDLVSLWKLFFFLRKEKPLIVHSHTPKAGTLAMIAAKLAGVPHRLHTVAGMPLLIAKGKKRKLLDIVEKITYFCATKIYPNSYGLEKIIIVEKYTAAKKLKVIGNGSSNGINTSYFNPIEVIGEQKNSLKKSLGLKDSDFVYLFVGRIVEDKGVNELITAFKNLSKDNNNLKLILAGYFENDLNPILPETVLEIKNNVNILNVGYQSDIRSFYAISDVFTFPSYREGFPNVVLQAGSMGLPCIVTNINGCNEIIIEGVNGIIVPPMNAKILEDKMLLVYKNTEYKNKLKTKARELIVTRYEQDVLWSEILAEYKKLLKHV
jgi:glycosyltransferase involved in cell wall biosynthesis